MKASAADLWRRAIEALQVAKNDLDVSADAAASRAYYAAFYAVSACFAIEDRSFTRHSAVEAAVHRDLVRSGKWPEELGKGYSRLAQLRQRGDYGGGLHVCSADAREAIKIATEILRTVVGSCPGTFEPVPDL